MKALSVKQPYASQIAHGFKRFEYRSWKTNHRGPLAIVASKSDDYEGDLPRACVVCVVDVVDCVEDKINKGYIWCLANARHTRHDPIKGYAAIYNIPDPVDGDGGDYALPPKVKYVLVNGDDEKEFYDFNRAHKAGKAIGRGAEIYEVGVGEGFVALVETCK